MKPNGGGAPTGKVADAINGAFGSFDKFKEAFTKEGTTRFGSGWAWLVKDSSGKLKVGSTANQDNPLMDSSDLKGTPARARCMGACLLPEIPEQTPRLHQQLVECC